MYMSICNTTARFVSILENIAGDQEHSVHGEVTVDTLLSAVKPLQGTFWYVPSAQELRTADVIPGCRGRILSIDLIFR